jgi:hypothetical protein
MTNKNQQLLLSLLEEYFTDIDITKRDVLSKNKVAALLKEKLSKLGHWKNRKRGKPSPNYFIKQKTSY